MPLVVQNQANYRGTAIAGYLERDQTNNLFVAQGAAPFTEMARSGGIWNVISAAATPLVVIPTTLTILEVYNNTTSNAVLEVVDVFIFELLGTAAVHNVSVWAQVTAPKAAPSTASLAIGNQSGRAKYTDTALTPVTTGAGTTVIANGWRPFSTANPAATQTATPGNAFVGEVHGKLFVPMGCSVCITAVDALATASSVQVGVSFGLRQLTAAIPFATA